MRPLNSIDLERIVNLEYTLLHLGFLRTIISFRNNSFCLILQHRQRVAVGTHMLIVFASLSRACLRYYCTHSCA